MSLTPQSHGSTRGLLWMAALVYTAFVIYGSLVPLEYRAIPWNEAVERFGNIRFLNLGIGSRADWMANLLLFIPLTFLWMGAWVAGKKNVLGVFAALALVPLAILFSVAIEFTQLYFPQRTVSQNDILAEALGALIGVLAWWGTGRRFVDWLQGWQQLHSRAALAERLAWVYLAGVLVYNVLPLDLTISLVEIFHKWQEGKLNLIPFGRLPSDTALAVYEIASDALIWVPLAFMWRLDGTRSAWRVWSMTLAAAVGLEFLQLFVFSRISDITDIFTGALGALMGALLAGRFGNRAMGTGPVWQTGIPLMFAVGWMGGLLFVFWYPFEFKTDGMFLRERLSAFMESVPFETYYYGTEFRAITELLHKTLFFIPLGMLLAWFVSQLRWTWRGIGALGSFVLIAGMALTITLGRLAIPDKHPDIMDIVLQMLGGLLGYLIVRVILSRKTLRVKAGRPAATRFGNTYSRSARSVESDRS